MTKAILTKLSSNNNALRTPTVEGYYHIPPTTGMRFTFYSEPLDISNDENIRIISTSGVTDVIRTESGLVFDTHNSTYQLEILETTGH